MYFLARFHRYTNVKHRIKTYRSDFLPFSSAWGRSEGEDLGSEHGLDPRQAEAHHRAPGGEGRSGKEEGDLGPQPREVAAEPRQCAQCGNCSWRWGSLSLRQWPVVLGTNAKMMIVFSTQAAYQEVIYFHPSLSEYCIQYQPARLLSPRLSMRLSCKFIKLTCSYDLQCQCTRIWH